MRAVTVLALGAAMVVGTGGVAFAQQTDSSARAEQERGAKRQHGERGMHRGERRGGPRIGRVLFRGIELSAEQRTSVQQINERYRAEHVQLRERHRAARTEGQRPDSAQRAAFREQGMQLMQRQRADLRGILTAEQRTTFDANVTRLETRMSERRAKGERRGRGERARPDSGSRTQGGS